MNVYKIEAEAIIQGLGLIREKQKKLFEAGDLTPAMYWQNQKTQVALFILKSKLLKNVLPLRKQLLQEWSLYNMDEKLALKSNHLSLASAIHDVCWRYINLIKTLDSYRNEG